MGQMNKIIFKCGTFLAGKQANPGLNLSNTGG